MGPPRPGRAARTHPWPAMPSHARSRCDRRRSALPLLPRDLARPGRALRHPRLAVDAARRARPRHGDAGQQGVPSHHLGLLGRRRCAWPTWTATGSTCRSSRRRRSCSRTAARPSTPWSAPASSTTRCWSSVPRGGGRLVPPRAGAAAGHGPGLPGAGALPGLRHEGRPDRQPRRRPRPGRRGPGHLPRALRLARRAGLRAPVGHVRRLPAGGLDARVDGGHAGRDPALAQPDDPRRGLRPAARRPAHLLRPRRWVVHVPAGPAGERVAPSGHRARALERRHRARTSTASRSTRRSTTGGRCATWST